MPNEMNPTFNSLCNLAAKDLPDGWEIRVILSTGYGGVEMSCPEEWEWYENHYDRIENRLLAAIQFARSHADAT